MTSTVNAGALAIGDTLLHQSYFVCITETGVSTFIEYGKSLGTSENGEVFLNYIDTGNALNVRFYAFGNDENELQVMDAHIVSRRLTETACRDETYKDEATGLCVQMCHPLCEPLAGNALTFLWFECFKNVFPDCNSR